MRYIILAFAFLMGCETCDCPYESKMQMMPIYNSTLDTIVVYPMTVMYRKHTEECKQKQRDKDVVDHNTLRVRA